MIGFKNSLGTPANQRSSMRFDDFFCTALWLVSVPNLGTTKSIVKNLRPDPCPRGGGGMGDVEYGLDQPYLLCTPFSGISGPWSCSDPVLLAAIAEAEAEAKRLPPVPKWLPPVPKRLPPNARARSASTRLLFRPMAEDAERRAVAPAAQGAVRSWADEHLLRVWSEVTSGQAALLGRGTFGCVTRG